jgi:hypothetical protein
MTQKDVQITETQVIWKVRQYKSSKNYNSSITKSNFTETVEYETKI